MKRLMVLFVTAVVFSARAEMEASTPEEQGVSSKAILAWIQACEKELDAVHGFVMVRHGRTIAEGWWKPFGPDRTHMLYSHSKSFTSTAIGFLVDEGKLDLDERVVNLFPDKIPASPCENLMQVRVRDLLTMNLGSDNDHLMHAGGDWEKIALAKKMVRRPGEGFRYDSDATYLLACIVERKSGMKMMDYLKKKLFDPIGITRAWTTFSPSGVACGGWGMNMTTREIARFGQFYLQRGVWNKKRLLSESWISLATTKETESGRSLESDWGQGYGFQFWRTRHNAYRADGAYGQFTVVMPDQDAVLSLHAALGNMQKELDLVWRYLLPAMEKKTLAPDESACAELRAKCAALSLPTIAGTASGGDVLFGKTFDMEKNRRGIRSVRVERNGAGWTCALTGPSGEYRFPVGYGKWEEGSLKFDKEAYEYLGALIGEQAVAASGAVLADNSFRCRIYLTGTTAHINFTLAEKAGELRVTGNLFGMGGCTFTGRLRK